VTHAFGPDRLHPVPITDEIANIAKTRSTGEPVKEFYQARRNPAGCCEQRSVDAA
jgi:hypothetical protein